MSAWIEFLESNAVKFAEKTAVVSQSPERTLSYKNLNDEVNALAAELSDAGLKASDCLAFHATQNTLHHLTLMLACSKLKAIFVPLNFRLSKNELELVLSQLDPKFYLGLGEKFLSSDSQYINALTLDKNRKAFDSDFEKTKAGMNDPILMLYTSGSTGQPKGVMFHGEMLLSNQRETCLGWGLTDKDITLVETPFFHTGGYNVLLLPLLYLGGTSILAESFVPDNVFNCIEQLGISVYFGVPTMFQMLLEKPRFQECNFSSVRFFISGGAACPIPMIEEYQKKKLVFKQGFGLTEVGPNCFLLDEQYAVKKAGSIGRPMPHSIVKVKTLDGRDATVGEPGELLLSGPHVTCGYYKNTKAFEETFKNGFFYTGDLVKFDADGFYFVVGRIKDMYISGGENVYPGEVEKHITSHEKISEAVVVAVPDEKWGEVGLAFLKTELDVTVAELRNYLNNHLSRYKHPHYVHCMKSFPLLPNGKVDRKTLKADALNIISSL